MNAVDVGRYLSELRKYYKITQDELATRLGVTRQSVSRWETGAAVPDIELLMGLSEIYGISINDILKADLSKIKFQKEIVFLDEEKKAKKIFVIGCGRWGTFIAWYLDKIGHEVTLYGRASSRNMRELMEKIARIVFELPSSILYFKNRINYLLNLRFHYIMII